MIHETTRDFRIIYNLSQSGLDRTRMEGFYVKDSEGPLNDGELERAAAWARLAIKTY